MSCTLRGKMFGRLLVVRAGAYGLTLKLKVSIGNEPEDIELQKSVDTLREDQSAYCRRPVCILSTS